ncbi:MAG: hypothetical protein Q7T54_02030 [Candidatus Levybacteria bacterium]|nr:hypothetical protein [Candidatus Levybacteria bacterium]
MEHSKPHHYSDVKTLISWSAPGRPFRKKGRAFYLNGLLIMFLVEVILFVFSEYLLMFVVATLYFFAVAITAVPPQNFHYRISTQGIKVEDHFYIWDELYDFYFKKIDGMDILTVRSRSIIPGELKISLGEVPADHIRRVMINYIPYREIVRPTFMEKSGEWLAKNFPLER